MENRCSPEDRRIGRDCDPITSRWSPAPIDRRQSNGGIGGAAFCRSSPLEKKRECPGTGKDRFGFG